MILLPNLVALIKKAALDAVEESKPTNIVYGEVLSVNPLKISISQNLILTNAQLILTRNVVDYELDVTVSWQAEEVLDHTHSINGKKKITIHNGLVIGDKVILLQIQGGQQFIVLDKVVVA